MVELLKKRLAGKILMATFLCVALMVVACQFDQRFYQSFGSYIFRVGGFGGALALSVYLFYEPNSGYVKGKGCKKKAATSPGKLQRAKDKNVQNILKKGEH